MSARLPLSCSILGLALLLASCGSTTAASHASSTTRHHAAVVTIQNYRFMPAALTVARGTRIVWTNKDADNHTVTANAGSASFGSGTLAKGASFAHTFTRAGVYTYHCSFHPFMKGTITVSAGSSSR